MTQPTSFGWPPAPPATDTRISGLILAAGKSERMGIPKALLPFRGKTFVENLVELFERHGADPIWVVTSRELQPVLRKLLPAKVRIPVALAKDKGQLDSLRAGLSAVGGIGHAVLVGLVDQPAVEDATLSKLLSTWKETRARAVAPMYDHQRGHPVVIGRSGIHHAFRGEPESMREVLDNMHSEIHGVPTHDAWTLVNVNLPDDYRRLISFHGSDAEKALPDAWESAALAVKELARPAEAPGGAPLAASAAHH